MEVVIIGGLMSSIDVPGPISSGSAASHPIGPTEHELELTEVQLPPEGAHLDPNAMVLTLGPPAVGATAHITVASPNPPPADPAAGVGGTPSPTSAGSVTLNPVAPSSVVFREVGKRRNPLEWAQDRLFQLGYDITTDGGLTAAIANGFTLTTNILSDNLEWKEHEYDDAKGEKYFALDIEWTFTINGNTETAQLRFCTPEKISPSSSLEQSDAQKTKILAQAIGFTDFIISHTNPETANADEIKSTMHKSRFVITTSNDKAGNPAQVTVQTWYDYVKSKLPTAPASPPTPFTTDFTKPAWDKATGRAIPSTNGKLVEMAYLKHAFTTDPKEVFGRERTQLREQPFRKGAVGTEQLATLGEQLRQQASKAEDKVSLLRITNPDEREKLTRTRKALSETVSVQEFHTLITSQQINAMEMGELIKTEMNRAAKRFDSTAGVFAEGEQGSLGIFRDKDLSKDFTSFFSNLNKQDEQLEELESLVTAAENARTTAEDSRTTLPVTATDQEKFDLNKQIKDLRTVETNAKVARNEFVDKTLSTFRKYYSALSEQDTALKHLVALQEKLAVVNNALRATGVADSDQAKGYVKLEQDLTEIIDRQEKLLTKIKEIFVPIPLWAKARRDIPLIPRKTAQAISNTAKVAIPAAKQAIVKIPTRIRVAVNTGVARVEAVVNKIASLFSG